jgi:CRISPR-associated endoribonuclease Cas6
MLSPLTLSTTYYEQEKKRTRFIAPVDEDFNDALNKNLADKFEAAFQKKPESLVMLTPVDFSKNHKYVTKFNNHIYINAWNGDYRLSGDPEILTFLYNSGLGSRNSEGFGMFELI